MTTNVRNGLVLLAIAAILEIISLAMGGSDDVAVADAADVAQGGAILFAIGGFALIILGLTKKN